MPKSASGALLSTVEIDRTLKTPLYKQLENFLRRHILEGILKPTQKLPSSRELAEDLGISRITVKSVYEQLLAEGYLKSRTGSGTFVSDDLEFFTYKKLKAVTVKPANVEGKLPDRLDPINSSQATIRYGETAPFRPGLPALDKFPIKTWNKYVFNAMSASNRHNLGYGSLNGSKNLRKSIAQHLADARGLRVDADQIVITSGAQQAFVLIAFALLKSGDTVWYENPGHIAGRDVMIAMGASVMPVPIDPEGLDLNYAKSTFETPKLIFATPSHQHPLGITMSLARRLALLEFASNNNSWIIEDDYDSEFRYRGRPLPALSALDEERRVFYVGTFSKALCSAVRLGYVVVPEWLIETFAKAMNLLGQNASPITEVALAQFINDGRFAEHIRKMRRLYRDRRDTLIECLSESCSDLLSFKSSDAGMHIIADLKSGIDDETAYRALLNNGIESLPLSVYCLEPIERSALILGFSGVQRKRMPKLVKKMSQILSTVH